MDGKGRRGRPNREWIGKGRPNREWIDDIKEWCKKDLHSLTTSARDRKLWKQTTKFALDTYQRRYRNRCVGHLSPMNHDDDDDKSLKSSNTELTIRHRETTQCQTQ